MFFITFLGGDFEKFSRFEILEIDLPVGHASHEERGIMYARIIEFYCKYVVEILNVYLLIQTCEARLF